MTTRTPRSQILITGGIERRARQSGRPLADRLMVRAMRRRAIAIATLCLSLAAAAQAAAAPDGQVTWGVHTTLVPAYFDPAETLVGTSFMVLYGLHDALVKPMPGKAIAPSLAESWTTSADGLVYEFVLRKGAKFHNGRAGHRRRRQVLVRALSRRLREDAEGRTSPRSRRRIPAASASGSASRGRTS